MRIGIFGADERMLVCAARARTDGHTVDYFTEPYTALPPSFAGLDALVLPVPASADGERIKGTQLSFLSLSLPRELPVFGGFIPKAWKENRIVFDCADGESFTLANASLTAEGAIASALAATGRGFYRVRIAICGYGRIAKLLAHKLLGFGVPITVYARRKEARTEASLCGFRALPLEKDTVFEEEILFNTVPAPVFDEVHAEGCIYCCDLGGGMPKTLKGMYGDTVLVHAARGVPGVFAPRAAGEIVYESLSAFLKTVRAFSSSERSNHT